MPLFASNLVNVTIGWVPTKETSSLKQTCPACGTVVDTAAAEPLARVECQKCGEKIRAERSFDQFALLETVGIGGMGTVYKARDTLLDRLVAVKLLRKDLGEGIDHAARLQQEARVAASVNHPNVIQVFSSGTDHGQFYLVMELVDHGSLDDLIEQQKRLPEELVLEAGIQVAKGLRAAHAKGLIHRDVKPANILFADEHTAKIGDFGLAGAAAEGLETRGEIWGTPYYVAPERLNNDPEDLRSDIYSLGATLFHAISGRAPIEGETNSAVTLRNLKAHPVDLSAVAPEISAATARVLQRTIAPDPAARFSSYDELVSELENAYGLLTGKEEFLAARKSKLPWIIGVAILLAALIGVATWGFLTRKSDRSALSAVSARAEQLVALAPLEAQLVEGRRQLLQNHFNVAGAAFARVATDARNKQPIYDWARFQQGLAAMVGRESSQAKQAFQDVQNAGGTGFAKENTDLARFFGTTAKTLLAAGVITYRQPEERAAPYSTFASLLFALRNIEQSDASDAVPWLEQFVAAKPTGQFSWIADLKPIAQKYLDDARLYAAWQKGSKANPPDISAQLNAVRDLRQKLKTKSVLSEELASEEKSLSARVAEQKRKEDSSRQQERKKLVDTEGPIWAAAQTNYRQKIAVYDFSGARDAASGLKLSEPSLSQAQIAAQKKAQWLVAWKEKLIADINRAHFTGPITDTTGVQYIGVEKADAQNLELKVPYGTARMSWTKLVPKTLLAISISYIHANEPDAADRSWLSAVFASETGQTDLARQLADTAAKGKAEYAAERALIK
ncbi:MAG: eukaryotic-like serine/threonine-protein kinase [Verrucomicrobiota bacterium]